MKNAASLLAIAALTFALPASHAQTADVPAVTEHMAIATKAAKSDLLGPLEIGRAHV